MNAQNEPNNQNPNTAPDWRTERQMRREERREMRRGSFGAGWMGGLVLIVLGVLILLQNFGGVSLSNWWALFILLPAAGAFGNAYAAYQKAGNHLNAAARGSLIGGLIFTMVAAAFLFNLNMSLLWPVLIILAGLGILLNVALP